MPKCVAAVPPFRSSFAILMVLAVWAPILAGCAGLPATRASSRVERTLSGLPPLPQPDPLQTMDEGAFISGAPAADDAGRAYEAMQRGTQGLTPGQVAGGRPETLEIRSVTPLPDRRKPLPPPPSLEVPAKPVLTLSLPR